MNRWITSQGALGTRESGIVDVERSMGQKFMEGEMLGIRSPTCNFLGKEGDEEVGIQDVRIQ